MHGKMEATPSATCAVKIWKIDYQGEMRKKRARLRGKPAKHPEILTKKGEMATHVKESFFCQRRK